MPTNEASRTGGHAPPEEIAPRLYGMRGEVEGKVYLLGQTNSIGRDESGTIVIEDPLASRQHARIEVGGALARIFDLKSRNGVFVNSQLISEKGANLVESDEIKIGNCVWVFSRLETREAAVAAAMGKKRKKGSVFTKETKAEDAKKKRNRAFAFALVAIVAILALTYLAPKPGSKDKQIARQHMARAAMFYKAGELDSATVELQEALRYQPQDATIQRNLERVEAKRKAVVDSIYAAGAELYKAGDVAGAIEKWREVLRLDPKHEDARIGIDTASNRGELLALLDQGEEDRKAGAFQTALAAADTVAKHASPQDEEIVGRVRALREATYQAMTEAAFRAGRWSDVVAYAARTLEVNVSNGVVGGLRERAQVKIREEEERRKRLEEERRRRLAQQPPSSGKTAPPPPTSSLTQEQKDRATELYRSGRALYKDFGKKEEALARLRQALEAAPDPNFEYYRKAKALIAEIEGKR